MCVQSSQQQLIIIYPLIMRDLSALGIPGWQGSVHDGSQWLSRPDAEKDVDVHMAHFWEKQIFMGRGILLPGCTLQSCDRNDPAPSSHRVWIQSAAQMLLLLLLLPQAWKLVQGWKQRALLPYVLWLLLGVCPVQVDPSTRNVQNVLTWECHLCWYFSPPHYQ